MSLTPDALTTPDRVRANQGWSDASYPNSRLIPKINALSAAFARLTGRRFGFRRSTDLAPLWCQSIGGVDLWLPWPIRALSKVFLCDKELTVSEFGYPALTNMPEAVFRSPERDREGWLHCPMGWPIALRSAPNVGVVGDFGWILPQYSGVVNSTHNPSGLASDLPVDLEEALFAELAEEFSTVAGNVRRERTPGGRELEFEAKGAVQSVREAALAVALSAYVLPSAWWAG